MLYVVSTPIGNLEDITLRALTVLKSVDVIAAEDTRHTQQLLNHYSIQATLISLHEHNEQQRIELLLDYFAQGKKIALVCDAGTPLISDPGYRIVAAAHAKGVAVIPVPGACAAIAALSASGLPTDRFVFEGFLPAKGAVRRERLSALKQERRTIILYESVHRIVSLLELIVEIMGNYRLVVVARELTKRFETIKQGCSAEILQWVQQDAMQRKGEFVVLIHGAEKEVVTDVELQRVLRILLAELSVKQAVSLAKEITGTAHKVLYNLALEIKKE